MARKPNSQVRWGEMDDDEENNLDYLLPPREVIGPDEKGIKKVIEYKFDEEGNKVKVTSTFRVRKITSARLSRNAVERRSWAKFGDAADEQAGNRLTMVSTEEILLERPAAPGTRADESNAAAGDSLTGGAVLMVCRNCHKKGDHWTARCPYKDQTETFTDRPSTSEASAGPTKGAYVPPSMRAGFERPAGSEMKRRNEENSVKVTNLSEDTREDDLRELFGTFGQISRAHVLVDRVTGMSRGFGFVNFVKREDGERAIAKLNGYGYDNLILKVEWSAPRTN